MDLLVVPTIGFDLLYALVIIRLQRRDLVWINGVFFALHCLLTEPCLGADGCS